MLGKTEGRKRRGRQDEMLGYHHQLNRREFEQTQGDSGGQRRLVCVLMGFSNHGVAKESDKTLQLNNNNHLDTLYCGLHVELERVMCEIYGGKVV